MPRSVVIVQARFGSTRLPGKVLERLGGSTVLSHVVARCHAISRVAEVCCAIPVGPANDNVAREAEQCGARVIRGSETDVLDRYYKAAQACQAEVIMRITSDCPLIDPVLAGGVLLNVVNGEADYSCNNLPRTWPHGLDCEAFTFDCLLQAAEEAKLPEEREHVTPYLRSHPKIRKTNIAGPGGEIARYRWTLDTAADLEFLKVVFEKLPEGPKGFNYPAVLDIVESDPRLRAHTNPQ